MRDKLIAAAARRDAVNGSRDIHAYLEIVIKSDGISIMALAPQRARTSEARQLVRWDEIEAGEDSVIADIMDDLLASVLEK